MALDTWEEKYRSREGELRVPDALLVKTAGAMRPGRALDVACGTGRNSLWLAQQGWEVTAVDGSPRAIEMLRDYAAERNLKVDACVADLEKRGFPITPEQWDLIASCYYFDRDVWEEAKRGLVPGGVMVAIALMVEPGKERSPYRVQSDELRKFFEGWEILDYRESTDQAHAAIAEIAARRPLTSPDGSDPAPASAPYTERHAP